MKSLLLLLFSFISITSFGQQTINGSIMHDNIQRDYILYVPNSYDANISAPLVFNFHGYSSNANEQMGYGDFRSIADTAGFILVHPMGTLDANGITYWNAQWGGATDDIGFTGALIDSLSASYNINADRIYSTGMSNGGFMSHTLACDLSDRFAAVASVTGSMTQLQVPVCNPSHPMPVMQIHGTDDDVVPYDGNNWMETIDNVISHWVQFNECDTVAIITPVPDINTSDGSTVEHHIYKNGNNGAEVEFYKVLGGGHTWPGTVFVFGSTNLDFSASEKVWQFFAQYDINGKIETTAVDWLDKNNIDVKIFPNPFQDGINISWKNNSLHSIRVINTLGKIIQENNVEGNNFATITSQRWNQGIYYLQFYNEKNEQIGSRKVLKVKK